MPPTNLKMLLGPIADDKIPITCNIAVKLNFVGVGGYTCVELCALSSLFLSA